MKIEKILEFIKCPYCDEGKLLLREENELLCKKCQNIFDIINGVPVLLKDDHLCEQENKQKVWFEDHYSKFSKEKYQLENWRLSVIERVFSSVTKKAVNTYLDIGCGATGYTVIEAARRNNWVSVGADISLEAMVRAKNLADKQNLSQKTAFVVCSAENLPFRDGSFDYISGISLLEHIENDKRVIMSIYDTLVKEGFFYVCVPNTYRRMWPFLWPIYYYFDKQIGHKRHYSLKSLNNLMEGYVLKDFFYNAHLRKLLEIILEKLGLSSKKKWWEVEKNDINKNSTGIQLNAVYQKT